jgi:hypothetical protein
VNKREYLRLRRELREEYDRKLAALNTVFKMYGGDVNEALPFMEGVEDAKHMPEKPRRGDLVKAIQEIVPKYRLLLFNAYDVRRDLSKIYPNLKVNESSVSSALKRLADSKGSPIELESSGRGRRASRYRNKAAAEKVSVA